MADEHAKSKAILQNQYLNELISGQTSAPIKFLTNQAFKMKSKQIGIENHENESRHANENGSETYKKDDGKRTINYIDVFNATNNFSQAIEFKPMVSSKGGRPRKRQSQTNPVHKRKKAKSKKIERYTATDIDMHNELDGHYNTILGAASLPSTTSVAEALDVIEKRKKSIKAKLMVKKENLLTQEEEQDIHTRADIYAITTTPDPQFYVSPDEDPLPRPSIRVEEVHIDMSYPPIRKKRRRNYGSANCYVNYHNNEDIFDNTKMLPIATRLIKPPTKLVELVAQAIDGSPDGLLQVQQIYTFLQNKYPFFRYMERMAINSWRSSIRHALYQKWFRKIRFDLSYISSKGCYWAINHKNNPKEWTLPDSGTILQDTDFDDYNLGDDLEMDPQLQKNVYALLQEEQTTTTEPQSDVVAIAREYGISAPSNQDLTDTDEVIDVEHVDGNHVPSPVREPDPILAKCVPYWTKEDICLSSTESGHGTMSPSISSPHFPSLESPVFLTDDNPVEIRAELLLGTPLSSPGRERSGILQMRTPYVMNANVKLQSQSPTDKMVRGANFSPIANWTPNWEEYGSYILSPQNMANQQYVLGWSLGRLTDMGGNYYSHRTSLGLNSECRSSEELGTADSMDNSPINMCCSETTGSTCSDIEIIAEFTKSEFSSPDLGNYGAIYE